MEWIHQSDNSNAPWLISASQNERPCASSYRALQGPHSNIVLPKKSSLNMFRSLDLTIVNSKYRCTRNVSDSVVDKIMVPEEVHSPVMSPDTYLAKRDSQM